METSEAKCFMAKKDPSAHIAAYFQFNLSARRMNDFAVPSGVFPGFAKASSLTLSRWLKTLKSLEACRRGSSLLALMMLS